MLAADRPIVASVVDQHVDGAVAVHRMRSAQAAAPKVKLHQLLRTDQRVAAHLDGIRTAGEHGLKRAWALFASPNRSEVFVIATLALYGRHERAFRMTLDVAQQEPQSAAGIAAALAWVSRSHLRGIVAPLLTEGAVSQGLGLSACADHGVDPGPLLARAFGSSHPALRATALRVARRLGKVDLLDACLDALQDRDTNVRREAAYAAIMLGDRGEACSSLLEDVPSAAADPAPLEALARVVGDKELARLITSLEAPALGRWRMRCIGAAGRTTHVPTLIGSMEDTKLARAAGAAFALICGIDLEALDLQRTPPNEPDGPSDDPDADDVAMDADHGLIWPDPEKVGDWWARQEAALRSEPRLFMGAPVAPDRCRRVLVVGTQPERIAAAEQLCVLQAGTLLFNTSAPAWRQERALCHGDSCLAPLVT